MVQRCFLGGNTCKGFLSLYKGFPPEEGAFLHVIKGCPGGGKSGFMRRIGAAAEERGLEVHYVLCSGDPDSLDGVYIPALHAAWVDGTAPHVTEPRHFGADGDYVNLGAFCRQPLEAADREKIRELTRRYRALYAEAYENLRQAKELHDQLEAVYRPYMDFDALSRFTDAEIARLFPEEIS
jgi:hypothetical protein